MRPTMYATHEGQPVSIADEQDWLQALRSGAITANTYLLVPGRSDWVPAGTLPEFPAWCAEAGVSPVNRPARAAVGGRLWLWVGVGLAAVATLSVLTFWMLRSALTDDTTVPYETLDVSRELEKLDPIPNLVTPSALEKMQVSGWARSYVRRAEQIGTAMQDAIDRHSVSTLLTPETMSTPESLQDALDRTKKLSAIVDGLGQRQKALLDGTMSSVLALDVAAVTKADLTGRMRLPLEAATEQSVLFFQIERQFYDEAASLLSFMQEAQQRGAYVVNGGQIIFQSQVDVDEYNRRIEEIQSLADREAQVQEALRVQSEALLGVLEPYIQQ